MKVVEQETEKTGGPGHQPEIWEGQRVVCPNVRCHKLLELEQGDAVRVISQAKSPDGPVTIGFTCSVCGEVGTATFTPLVGLPYTRGGK